MLTSSIINSNTRLQARYLLSGEAILESSISKHEEAEKRVPHVEKLQSYFEDEINRFPGNGDYRLGIGPGTAALEIIGAFALAVKSFSAATAVNFLTSGAEFFETVIAGTHILEPKKEREIRDEIEALGENGDKVKIKELKQELNREKTRNGDSAFSIGEKGSEELATMAISTVQLGAGVVGGTQTLFSLGRKFSGREEEQSEMSLFDKIWLSAASLVNAGLMLFASGEKTLISSLMENRGLEDESGKKLDPMFEQGTSIRKNAESDFRCFLEWTGMAFFTWFKNLSFKNISIKDVFDIGISLKATWEGSEYFRKYGQEDRTESGKSLMGNVLGLDLGKLYLGTESKPGIRERAIVPFLEMTGANPPRIFTRGEEVICEVEVPNASSNNVQETEHSIAQDPSPPATGIVRTGRKPLVAGQR